MAVRAGVLREEEEVAGEMSFWGGGGGGVGVGWGGGRVSSLPVKKVVFRATGRPVMLV